MPKEESQGKTKRRSGAMSALELVLASSKKQDTKSERKTPEVKTESAPQTKESKVQAEDNNDIQTATKNQEFQSSNPVSDSSIDSKNSGSMIKSGEIFSIPTHECIPWEFSDRLETDLGDLGSLIKSLEEEGQQQPALLRPLPYSDATVKYEIVFGIRRWHACQKLGINLLARMENLNDREAADRMISENLRRENISEYARCKSYKGLIESGIYSDQSDLANKVGLSKSAISDLFIFNRLPTFISEEISNFNHVSIATALKLNKLKDLPGFKVKLKSIAPAIIKGEIHSGNLQRKLTENTKTAPKTVEAPLVYRTKSGICLEVKRDIKGDVRVRVSKDYVGDRSIEGIFNSIKTYLK